MKAAFVARARRAGDAVRRRREAFSHGVGNFVRLAIMGILFVFLLTMAITLTEVMSFQNRVVDLVGDESRARSAVLMLHRIENNPDAYPEEETLPFAAMAIFLDRVRSAQEQLGRFRDLQRLEPEEDDEAAREESVRSSFTQEKARLVDNLNDLRRVLTQQEPQVVVASRLSEIAQAVEGLQAFAVATEEVPAEPAPASADGRGEMAARLAAIQADLVAIDSLVATNDIPPGLAGELKDLGGSISELNRIASGVVTGPPTRERTPTAEGVEAAALLAEKARALQGSVAALQAAIQLDPLNQGVAGELDALTVKIDDLYAMRLADPSGYRAGFEPPEPKAATSADYQTTLDLIGKTQSDLDQKLTSRFNTDYTIAKQLAANINEMRDNHNVFDELVPATYASAAGDLSTAKEAADLYQKTLAELNQGFTDLERSLGDRTRVVAVGNVIRVGNEESELLANAKAQAILHDFDALDRFGSVLRPLSLVVPADWSVAGFGLHPQKLATLSTVSITTIYIFMIGAIGSLLYIAKFFIGQALQGHSLTDRPSRPLSWLVFRPMFGIVVAFALYLMVRAGQLAFGTDGDNGFGTDLNIPIISVVALLAGLLSWQALAAIESRGTTWFGARTRQPLWATGLGNALRHEDKTLAACAHQVGRSAEQVERWLLFIDQVTVEMQDRLTTWLGRPIDELFSDRKPAEELGGKPLWATGLKLAMDTRERRLDAKGLAELLHEEDETRVRRWIDLRLQVSPQMQWQLVDALGVPHHQLFDRYIETRPAWPVGLRAAMRDRKLRARALDERIRLGDIARVRRWMELDDTVPIDWQDDLVGALDRPHAELFTLGDLGSDVFQWAYGLDERLGKADRTAEDLAVEVDVEVDRVEAWIRRTKGVPPATRKHVASFLGCREDEIFKPHRGELSSGTAPDGAAGEGADGSDGGDTPEESDGRA